MYCFTQCISKLLGSFEIHWVKQYLENFTCLVGIVNTTVYTRLGQFQVPQSWAWQTVLILSTACENLNQHTAISTSGAEFWENLRSIPWLLCQVSFNSLAPGRPGCHFKTAIFNLVLLIGVFTASNDNALRWMPWHLTDDKSTWVQVMAWCHQAASHYLSQCWPGSMSPYGITRPQWVKKW